MLGMLTNAPMKILEYFYLNH